MFAVTRPITFFANPKVLIAKFKVRKHLGVNCILYSHKWCLERKRIEKFRFTYPSIFGLVTVNITIFLLALRHLDQFQSKCT